MNTPHEDIILYANGSYQDLTEKFVLVDLCSILNMEWRVESNTKFTVDSAALSKEVARAYYGIMGPTIRESMFVSMLTQVTRLPLPKYLMMMLGQIKRIMTHNALHRAGHAVTPNESVRHRIDAGRQIYEVLMVEAIKMKEATSPNKQYLEHINLILELLECGRTKVAVDSLELLKQHVTTAIEGEDSE